MNTSTTHTHMIHIRTYTIYTHTYTWPQHIILYANIHTIDKNAHTDYTEITNRNTNRHTHTTLKQTYSHNINNRNIPTTHLQLYTMQNIHTIHIYTNTHMAHTHNTKQTHQTTTDTTHTFTHTHTHTTQT